MIHIDTKKPGRIDGIGHRITGHRTGMVRNRGIGWEHLHVAVDDASRLAYTELPADELKASAIAFLERALAWFSRHGVTVERAMTDNGSAYRSRDFRQAIQAAGLRHSRTRPYIPTARLSASFGPTRANGAYARPFRSCDERANAMRDWITASNHSTPPSALGGRPPIHCIARDNPLGNDT